MTTKFQQDPPPNELRDLPRAPARERVYHAVPWKEGTVLTDQDEASVVSVEDAPDRPRLPLPIYFKHGSGHAWGYPGSGPSQLALDLLLDVLGEWPARKAMDRGDSLAWWLHHYFKDEVIARLDQQQGWQMPGSQIVAWVREFIARHPELYNEWMLGMEEQKLLAAMSAFEQRHEDDETISASEQEAYDAFKRGLEAIDQLRDSREFYQRALSAFAASHGYPPFAADQ